MLLYCRRLGGTSRAFISTTGSVVPRMAALVPINMVNARAYSRSSPQRKSDQEELREFNDPWKKLVRAFKKLSTQEGGVESTKLMKANPQIPSLFRLGLLFADMQNPVLKKYDFDVGEFRLGAKEAFRQIQLAIASKDLMDYATKAINQSDSADFLKSTMSYPLYRGSFNAAAEMGNMGHVMLMEDIEVDACAVLRVHTFMGSEFNAFHAMQDSVRDLMRNIDRDVAKYGTAAMKSNGSGFKIKVVDVDDKKDSSKTTEGIRDESNSSRDDGSKSIPDKSSKPSSSSIGSDGSSDSDENDGSRDEEPVATPNGSREIESFPDEAVLADVDVYFYSNETYKVRETGQVNTRRATTIWTFRGCISGHKELEWKVVAFDGLAGSM